MISAKVIADTYCVGSRLTTFELVYPRFIHSEVMTHRQFSRNSASSRAIPISTMIAAVEANPAMPVFWGKNQAGMQAAEALSPEVEALAREAWLEGMQGAVATAKRLMALGVHKQIANRPMEPWMHMTTLLSSTEWENFYHLRTDPQAQPEFQALAEAMLAAHNESLPALVTSGYWHLPYITAEERQTLSIEDQMRVSVARCARTSYSKHGQVKDLEDDRQLHDRLAKSGHWSPFEHVAMAEVEMPDEQRVGNFVDFVQYRHWGFSDRECVDRFDRLLTPLRDRNLTSKENDNG